MKTGLRNTARALATIGAMVAMAGAAAAFESPADGVYADRIDWGMSIDMSGPAAASQHPWAKGFVSHMKAINAEGGVHGRQINVLAEDTRYDTTAERVAYEKLSTQTPALGLSGMGNSSAQTALVPLFSREKLPVVGTYTSAKAAFQPANPYFYGGFCGFKQMAQVGANYFIDSLDLENARVATVHLDVASGQEFNNYMDEVVTARGGTNISVPIKVVAADATAQILALLDANPDFVAIHGVATTAQLVLRGMEQYGVDVPSFAITYLGTPGVYEAVGEAAGSKYHFVSCFTPGSAAGDAAAEMIAAAENDGHSAFTDDINFVSGWVIAGVVADVLERLGAEPTREKLVEMMSKGYELPASGLASQLIYTSEDHEGLKVLQPIGYDYATKTFRTFGDFADFEKYTTE